MINKEVREDLAFSAEDAMLFDEPAYDNSIVGITTDGRVIYNYDMMVLEYLSDNGGTEEDARDFVSYNTIRSLDYISNEMKPIVMYSTYVKEDD